MNRFFNFSADIKNAFENDEDNYMNFSKLLKDTRNNVFEAGVTKADANELIREKFRLVLGVDEKASAKEIKRAIKRHKNEIFEVIEDEVEDMLTSGWGENPFFKEFVEVRNLALGDQNEFTTEDKSVLSVGRISGNHWDIDRQRLGYGESFRVTTYWVGLGVYEEFEHVMTGRADWTKLVNAIYTALDTYVNGIVYKAVLSAGEQILPSGNQFYKTAALDSTTKSTFITMLEDVQGANQGTEVVIMGTKTAVSKLDALCDVQWLSEQDKLDRRNIGHVGIWQGTRVVEIPQVFAKNDTTTKLVPDDRLLIMPVADNKFVKLVYEGNSETREITDNKELNDMTYEFKYLTKLGVAALLGRYFGVWNFQ